MKEEKAAVKQKQQLTAEMKETSRVLSTAKKVERELKKKLGKCGKAIGEGIEEECLRPFIVERTSHHGVDLNGGSCRNLMTKALLQSSHGELFPMVERLIVEKD